MQTHGGFSPATAEAARERYDELGPAAQTAIREATTAMAFEKAEYDERVTDEVVERVRNALFASLLEVKVGSREEFDEWVAEHPEYDPHVIGSENVDRVAWHAAPFAETVAAATFAHEERAAVETLRRQMFGRIYRDLF